eukprot:CAMPEP_0171975970 /NCGR_PEP_ID=MMETSP0993-20121228/239750_1 /TAXON_ID=483369 /ORGANISM="non described non described, Strain CCMP2098" /LENGTH=100 /DNA_ID=CAMNT_0012627369 /DNA_START=36 /DNA_END=338 /DNA_ORIENTATION=+
MGIASLLAAKALKVEPMDKPAFKTKRSRHALPFGSASSSAFRMPCQPSSTATSATTHVTWRRLPPPPLPLSPPPPEGAAAERQACFTSSRRSRRRATSQI